jgi:hypothetical protein
MVPSLRDPLTNTEALPNLFSKKDTSLGNISRRHFVSSSRLEVFLLIVTIISNLFNHKTHRRPTVGSLANSKFAQIFQCERD